MVDSIRKKNFEFPWSLRSFHTHSLSLLLRHFVFYNQFDSIRVCDCFFIPILNREHWKLSSFTTQNSFVSTFNLSMLKKMKNDFIHAKRKFYDLLNTFETANERYLSFKEYFWKAQDEWMWGREESFCGFVGF